MADRRRGLFNNRQGLILALIVAIAVHFLLQYGAFGDAWQKLHVVGPDDAMRLVGVRDFIAGQGWYDMSQHRVLPPEGLSLHWSRFVDMGLLAIFAVARLFTDVVQAEIVLTWVWPGLLFVTYLLLLARAGSTGFSRSAASLAVLAAAVLPMVNASYFPVGRLDHHSIQIVFIVWVVALLMDSSGGARQGVAIGAIAAVSLSIGLETLVPMFLAGAILATEFVLDRPFAAARLSGFAAGVLGLTPLLFVASQPPWELQLIECDQFSLPYMLLMLAGSSAILFAVALRLRIPTPMGRVLLLLVVGAVAVAAIWPVAQTCAGGPFSAVPELVRREVMAMVTENTPALSLVRSNPGLAIAILVPHAVITLICLVLLWRGRGGPKRSMAILCAFLLLGVAGAIYQFRALAWGGAVQALAIGVILAWLSRRPRVLVALPAALLLLFVVLSPQTLARPLLEGNWGGGQVKAAPLAPLDASCSKGEVLAALKAAPRGRVLNPLNLGAQILLHSPHSVLAAPYHRNPAAMLNGLMPFREPAATARDTVERHAADYVVVCDDPVGHLPQDAFRRRLVEGDLPVWLEPVPGFDGPLLVFSVEKSRL